MYDDDVYEVLDQIVKFMSVYALGRDHYGHLVQR